MVFPQVIETKANGGPCGKTLEGARSPIERAGRIRTGCAPAHLARGLPFRRCHKTLVGEWALEFSYPYREAFVPLNIKDTRSWPGGTIF